MNKRINIVLPGATIHAIDRMVERGGRSRFINKAIVHYVATRSTEALRRNLERTAVRDKDLDREAAADWCEVDQQAWQQVDIAKEVRKPATRGEAKSTSLRSIRR